MPEPIPSIDPHALVRRHYSKPSFLPPADANGSGFVAVQRLEQYVFDFRLPMPPHRSQVYAVLLLNQGQLVRTDGLATYTLGPGMLYFDAPGQIMSVQTVTPDCTGYFVLFDAAFFLGDLRPAHTLLSLPFFQPEHSPLVSLPPTDAAALHGYFTQMLAYFQTPEQPDRVALISTLLYLVCLRAKQFCRAAPPEAASAAALLAHRFQRLLPGHILRLRTVAEYADLLAVTPDYLSKCVKRTTGRTAGELITAMRVLEASVLLRQTTLSVAEVATELGFEDVSYFGRLLRRHTGFSPTAYRHHT